MIRALVFGLGVGAAVQAFRQWPSSGPVTANGVAVVFVFGLVCAFFAGRARRGGASATATATATASAESTASAQSVQVVNVHLPDGTRPVAERIDQAAAMPWWSSPYAGEVEAVHEDVLQDFATQLEGQTEDVVERR